MDGTGPRPAFVDASYAAEMLGVATADILDWIGEGRLAPFGGPDRNPFVRLADVERVAADLGTTVTQPSTRRRVAQNPVRRVALRVQHDAKWNEITESDIASWVRELDDSQAAAALTVAHRAQDRIGLLIRAVEHRFGFLKGAEKEESDFFRSS